MGTEVEFSPGLELMAFGSEWGTKEECLPEKLEKGEIYSFLKEGQRNHLLDREINLSETDGNQNPSIPLASITILEYTHYLDPRTYKPLTSGLYLINKVYKPRR